MKRSMSAAADEIDKMPAEDLIRLLSAYFDLEDELKRVCLYNPTPEMLLEVIYAFGHFYRENEKCIKSCGKLTGIVKSASKKG